MDFKLTEGEKEALSRVEKRIAAFRKAEEQSRGMIGVIRNYLAVARYCWHFPHPRWKYPWVCWHVYLWRKEIGIIHPNASVLSLLRGVNSYGRWLRQPWKEYYKV